MEQPHPPQGKHSVDCMSNVIDFPAKGEMSITVDLDESADNIDFVANQMSVVMSGLDVMTDITWKQMFQGCMVAAIFAAQNADMEPDDVTAIFQSVRIQDGDNEGC